MKIYLKTILTAKRLIVLAVSMITSIVTILIIILTVRTAPETKIIIIPPVTKPRQVAVKPRSSSINKKISVIVPVNLVDDAFKRYDLNNDSGTDNQIAEEQATSQVNGNAKAAHEEMAVQHPQAEKAEKQLPEETKQETMKVKEAKPGEPVRDVAAAQSGRPAGKDNASVVRSVVQDEGVSLLAERLNEAGLSETNRNKMIQSYLELRKVLPEREAQKMIMWKIVHERK